MAGLTWFADYGHIADDVMTRQFFGAVVLLLFKWSAVM
jgi:hypothetical protein